METPDTHVPGWVLAGILTIIGTLSSAVVFMFKLGQSQSEKALRDTQASHTEAIAKLQSDNGALKSEAAECRKDREELRVRLASLETRIELITGQGQ